MKILVVNNNFFLRGGAERAFFDMINILEEKGHDVAAFSTKTKKDYNSPWSKHFVKYYELSDSSRFNSLQKIKIVSRIWYNFETRKRLRKLLEEFKPDVAHLHNIFHHLSPSVIDELKKHNIPIVWTLHDYKIVSPNYDLSILGRVWEGNKGGKWHRCVTDKCVHNSYSKSMVCVLEALLHNLKGTYKKVDYFISPSDFLIGKYKEFGFKPEIKKVVNPVVSDVDCDTEIEPWKLGIGDHRNGFILYFGRLSMEKGVADLLEAFSELRTNKQLVIAGDGPELENLQFLAKKLKLTGRVQFLGYVEKEKLFNIIQRSSFVVAPSRCYENAPYGMLEAMSLGKTVISSQLGGLEEIARNSGAGICFRMGDKDDLKEKLEYALQNEEEMNLRGQKNKQFVEEKYNKEIFYQNLRNIYEKVSGK